MVNDVKEYSKTKLPSVTLGLQPGLLCIAYNRYIDNRYIIDTYTYNRYMTWINDRS